MVSWGRAPRAVLLGVRVARWRRVSSFSQHILDAERLVGYPTSLLGLKHLLGDELAFLASHLKRLIGSKHPVVKIAREVLLGSTSSIHLHGVVVLLTSQLVNRTPGIQSSRGRHDNTGIMPSQRALADITEMIHAAHLIHLSLLDVRGCGQNPRGEVRLMDTSECSQALEEETSQPDIRGRDQGPSGEMSPEESKDLEFGNKLSILSGDLLLAKACVGLARLHTPKVVEIISKAIADMMVGTAHTATDTNKQGSPPRSPSPLPGNVLTNIRSRVPKWMGLQVSLDYHTTALPSGDSPLPVEHWEKSAMLLHGSLLAQSCRAAAILAGAESRVQESAASFASNLSLATQVSLQLQPEGEDPSYLGRVYPHLTRKHASKFCTEYVDHALRSLSQLPSCEASLLLRDLLVSLPVNLPPDLLSPRTGGDS